MRESGNCTSNAQRCSSCLSSRIHGVRKSSPLQKRFVYKEKEGVEYPERSTESVHPRPLAISCLVEGGRGAAKSPLGALRLRGTRAFCPGVTAAGRRHQILETTVFNLTCKGALAPTSRNIIVSFRLPCPLSGASSEDTVLCHFSCHLLDQLLSSSTLSSSGDLKICTRP